MLFVAVGINLLQSVLIHIPVVWTTRIVDGQCSNMVSWSSDMSRIVYMWFYNVITYFLPIFLFIFCYGNIVMSVRRQVKISVTPTSATETASKKSTNVIVTMIIVSATYVVTALPLTFFAFGVAYDISLVTSGDEIVTVNAVFAIFVINVILDPFIYAICHHEVRQLLRSKAAGLSRKITNQPETVNTMGPISDGHLANTLETIELVPMAI